MYFPVSGIEIAWYIPPLSTAVLSFFMSMAGVSGAFLLLPFQVIVLGYNSPSVSATNHFYNIVATPNGIYRFYKEKRLLAPLARDMLYGSITAMFFATIVRSFFLNDPDLFNKFAACLLLYLTYHMIKDTFNKDTATEKPKDPYSLELIEDTKTTTSFRFDGKEYTYSRKKMILASGLISSIGGIYGVGGGVFFAPLLISYFKLPIYISAAANLLSTLMCAIVSVILYFILSNMYPEMQLQPDYLLGALFGIGGVIGMTLGSRTQKFVSARFINILIICVLIITCMLWLKPLFLD